MLIIAGTMEVQPDRRDEILKSREEGMRASRAEAGCVDYVFSADPLEPGRIYLFERWESKEALAAHLTRLRAEASTPAASGAQAGPPPKMDFLQYEIAATGPIGS